MGPEAAVKPATLKQLLMRPFLDNAPLIHHDQPIHGRNRAQAMGNRENGFSFHQPIQALLDGGFDFAIERACRLIQNQDRCIF